MWTGERDERGKQAMSPGGVLTGVRIRQPGLKPMGVSKGGSANIQRVRRLGTAWRR